MNLIVVVRVVKVAREVEMEVKMGVEMVVEEKRVKVGIEIDSQKDLVVALEFEKIEVAEMDKWLESLGMLSPDRLDKKKLEY
jgi:hypothetical protein